MRYGKLIKLRKLMEAATKTGIDAAKVASKRVFQKTAEATRNLIGNKISDKITSIDKPKEKEKTKEKRNRRKSYSARKQSTND